MSTVVVGVLIVVALVLGVLGNRWWGGHHAGSDEGLDINDLITPLTTLATIPMSTHSARTFRPQRGTPLSRFSSTRSRGTCRTTR